MAFLFMKLLLEHRDVIFFSHQFLYFWWSTWSTNHKGVFSLSELDCGSHWEDCGRCPGYCFLFGAGQQLSDCGLHSYELPVIPLSCHLYNLHRAKKEKWQVSYSSGSRVFMLVLLKLNVRLLLQLISQIIWRHYAAQQPAGPFWLTWRKTRAGGSAVIPSSPHACVPFSLCLPVILSGTAAFAPSCTS